MVGATWLVLLAMHLVRRQAGLVAVCHSRSIAAFIWDDLAPSGWINAFFAVDATVSAARCAFLPVSARDPEDQRQAYLRTYPEGDYLPMLWDTFRIQVRTHWIDFKYQRGRSPWGLTNGWFWRRHNLRVCCERTNATAWHRWPG